MRYESITTAINAAVDEAIASNITSAASAAVVASYTTPEFAQAVTAITTVNTGISYSYDTQSKVLTITA